MSPNKSREIRDGEGPGGSNMHTTLPSNPTAPRSRARQNSAVHTHAYTHGAQEWGWAGQHGVHVHTQPPQPLPPVPDSTAQATFPAAHWLGSLEKTEAKILDWWETASMCPAPESGARHVLARSCQPRTLASIFSSDQDAETTCDIQDCPIQSRTYGHPTHNSSSPVTRKPEYYLGRLNCFHYQAQEIQPSPHKRYLRVLDTTNICAKWMLSSNYSIVSSGIN